MTDRDPFAAAAALVAFTLISSFLGLSGRLLFFDPAGSFAFMAEVWSASVIADVVFAAGSLAAATLGFVLARRANAGVAIVASLGANWLVYYLSFLLLPEGLALGSTGGFEALWFVGAWGVVGLLFAGFAPPLAAIWWERRERTAPVDEGAASIAPR